ncbi:hypothetical protein E9993_18050 [Labilibacter sediminis]|nr:hypothetical protein E9993_18050 [Labilibacter sediminis]
MTMKVYSIILFLLISLCNKMPGQSNIKFPELKKWNLSDTVITYNKESLWEHINGAADYYLKYGFKNLDVVEYINLEKEYISVEVYQHQSPLYAFGIYAYERPEKTTYLKLGVESYLEETTLNLCVDNYYIKILGNNQEDGTIETMKEIARYICENATSSNYSLSALMSFPKENMIQHSTKFYPKNYLGHSFLTEVLEVSYRKNKSNYKAFFITCTDQPQALKVIENYLDFTDQSIKIEENQIIKLDDLFNGSVHIIVHSTQVIGIHSTEDAKLANEFLNHFLSQL